MSSHIIYTIIDLKWLELNGVAFLFGYFDCFAFNWNMVVILKGLKAKIVQNQSSKASERKKFSSDQPVRFDVDRSIDRTEQF